MSNKKFGLVVSLFLLIAPLFFLAPAAQANSCKTLNASWVAEENSRAGVKDWNKGVSFRLSADFSRRKQVHRIEGYFAKTSIQCGENVELNLVGTKRAEVEIFRMGYYQGLGARKLGNFTISSGWKFKAESNYLPGQYLFKIKSFNRASTFVPLVINNSSSKSDLTFISSVLTWQSYNQWGGYSLYKGPDGKRESRNSEVSFLRPYDGDGSGQLRYMELPIIRAAEKLGLNMNYSTDFDLDANPNLLAKTKNIVLGGHSEYWTTNMRDAVEAAVNSGVNLIVFGGNTAYNRIEINEKKILNIQEWRKIGRPEVDLLGSQFFTLGFKRDMIIETNLWPFDVLPVGSVIKGVFGYEADTPITFAGPSVETIARSSILPYEKSIPAMATYYTRDSGAGILNMATNGQVCAIEDKCPWGHRFDEATQKQLSLVTENVLKEAARGPLGAWRTAVIQNNAPSQ